MGLRRKAAHFVTNLTTVLHNPISDQPSPRSTEKMLSSIEAGTAWSIAEDVLLCQCWVRVCHHLIEGTEMKLSLMLRKIHGEFQEKSGLPRTEQGLQSRWKILNKELSKWRDAKKKAQDNYQSGTSLGDEVTKKKDLSDFYLSLNMNVAFGAGPEESAKPSKQEGPVDRIQETERSSRPEAALRPAKERDKARVRAEPSQTIVLTVKN